MGDEEGQDVAAAAEGVEAGVSGAAEGGEEVDSDVVGVRSTLGLTHQSFFCRGNRSDHLLHE